MLRSRKGQPLSPVIRYATSSRNSPQRQLMGQDGNTVASTLQKRDTSQQLLVRSKYVIGCDGAKSQVRKSLDIDSEGENSCSLASHPTSPSRLIL